MDDYGMYPWDYDHSWDDAISNHDVDSDVFWFDDPIFDDEGEEWRLEQYRKERVARFLAVMRCVPRMKRWATRAARTCYMPGGSVACRLIREWEQM